MKIIHIEHQESSNSFTIEIEGLSHIIIKSSLGAKCLYQLIRNEGRSFKPSALRDLIKNKVDISTQTQKKYDITTKEERIIYQVLNNYIPATDIKTIIATKKRKTALDQELLEAKEHNDLKRIDDIITEKEDLEGYLIESVNINGTIRNLNKNNRKATRSITHALDLTLKEIAEKSRDIYHFLKDSIIVSGNQVKFSPNLDKTY